MLTPQQIEQYRSDGFLIVDNFFSDRELQPVIDEIEGLVDRVAAKLYDAGKIADRHENEGFLTRLTALEKDSPGASVLVHIAGILGPNLASLWASDKLLDVVEQIIGPEIAGHPVWNIRSKTPVNPLATVPWHQDTAYLASGAETTFQPTAWIPLIDVGAEEGTLQVVRGGHRSGRVFPHHLEKGRGDKRSWYLYIDDDDLPKGEIVTCNMNKGSVLFLNHLIPHRSTENVSNKIRWSVDLRWQRPDQFSGFEEVKPCILMRTATDPTYRPDWQTWGRMNRVEAGMLEKPRDEFDTTVSGPWMERWT